MSFLLNCLILGEEPENFFTVKVSNAEYLAELKERIKEERAIRLAQVHATELELRLVNFRLDDLESKLANLALDTYPKPLFYLKVSSLFGNAKPSDDCLHLIVVAPGTLTLFCAIEAEEIALNSIFLIEIDSRQDVSRLKYAIKETVKDAFDQIPAHGLVLFKVSIPIDITDREKDPIVDVGPLRALLPVESLSQLFPRVDASHLHIIIRVPVAESGETRRDRISALNKRFQNVLSRIVKATPPSESAKSSAYTKSLIADSIYDGRYEENNPRTSVAPPIQLFHPTFAHFLDNLKGTGDIPDDIIRRTAEYMKASSAIYATEENRSSELTPMLCDVLGIDARTILNTDGTNAEGVVELVMAVGCFLIFLKEDKNEFEGGDLDPSTQAALSMGRFWAQSKFRTLRNATNCPTFVVAAAGPWIVILGAVFTDGLVVQRLTDYIWVGLDSVLNEAHISRVARIFYALKNGLDNLKSYYEKAELPGDRDLPTESRYFPSITAYSIGDKLVHFKYLGFLEDGPDCMVLRAQTLTAPALDIVVKFADRYGERAHRLLADNGLAPELLYCGSPRLNDEDPSYESLFMIVMGFVEGTTLANSKLNKETAETVRRTLGDALKLLHDNGLVFGDFRSPNVMITPAKGVSLIDFNWAGEEGQASYPYLISPGILWPPGVQPLSVIKSDHDLQMLENMFWRSAPFITTRA
ncbi:hypothetical protein GALMADRAFT_91974 [Galerina marginata CBS 339.88]|uniref:Protein kinase domain-containing protein n=1 Tax=Galerina marginata (strain CBS 339.88) TaxID=685588 RepID=A0A067TBU1_GALM3|nr:hypothetical protein GALMADRAFT_91974 [Galerina marginata CBS 339.88]